AQVDLPPDPAARRLLVHPVDAPHEGGLAAPRRPNDGRHLPGGQGEGNVVEGLEGAEGCVEMFHPDGHRHDRCLPSSRPEAGARPAAQRRSYRDRPKNLASTLVIKTIATRTSAPVHAFWCHSG